MSSIPIVLQLELITKSYEKSASNALGPLTLSLFAGEFTVIVGPSGCGKTTLLRLVAGLEEPDAGIITLHGKRVAGFSSWVGPEDRSIGMVFQDFSLFPHLTVDRNVYFGLKKNRLATKQIEHIENLLELLGLSKLRARFPHELSGGEQQRVAVARALAHQPALILFDEPFSNLDAQVRPRMRRELKKLLRELKSSALFVTHDQTEAIELADRMAVLRNGQLEQFDTPEIIWRSPATRFVAEFVSDADFISGHLRQNRLQTEIGNFAIKTSRVTDAPVEAMVNPRSVELRVLAEELAKERTAHIVWRQFRGNEILYVIRLPSGQELRAITGLSTHIPERTDVEITLIETPTIFYQGKRLALD
jgi:iron(III) transport system ATP-binding protein